MNMINLFIFKNAFVLTFWHSLLYELFQWCFELSGLCPVSVLCPLQYPVVHKQNYWCNITQSFLLFFCLDYSNNRHLINTRSKPTYLSLPSVKVKIMSEREGRNDKSSKLRPWRLKPTSKAAVWGQLWLLVSPGWIRGLPLNFKKESKFSVSVRSFRNHVWRPDTNDFTIALILEQMYHLNPSQKEQ